jgi:hypothetical protein
MCTGSSADCTDDNIVVTAWELEQTCENGLCRVTETGASCETCEHGCDEGACLGASDADLIPIGVDPSGAMLEGTTLRLQGAIHVSVLNLGPGDITDDYNVILFEDRNLNRTFDAQDPVLGERAVQATHRSGEEIEVSVDVDAQISFLGNLVYAVVDTLDAIDEIDESNNTANSMVNCEYFPPVGAFDPVIGQPERR